MYHQYGKCVCTSSCVHLAARFFSQHQMDRVESRSSQVLQISKWLREAQEEDTVSFIKFWKTTFENINTIGELLSLIIIKTQSQLLTETSISNLLTYCKQHEQLKSTQQKTQTRKVPTKVSGPCIKQLQHFSLVSLPFDIFNQLGLYLNKREAITLGYCCHTIYNATQTIQFLKASGCHHLVLNDKKLSIIYDFNIDPWSWCVGCSGLTIDHTNQRHVSSEMFEQLMIRSRNTTQWFNTLMTFIQQFRVVGDGTKFLPFIPMDQLFGRYSDSRDSDSDVRTQTRKRGSVRLILERVWWSYKLSVSAYDTSSILYRYENPNGKSGDSIPDLETFVENYSQYYTDECDSQLCNIRGISGITIDHTNCSSYIHPILKTLSNFAPNYQSLTIIGSNIYFWSLGVYIHTFHYKMQELSVQYVTLRETLLLCECLNAATEKGETLRIDGNLIKELYDLEKANEIAQLFRQDEGGNILDNINHMLANDTEAICQELSEAETFAITNDEDTDVEEYAYTLLSNKIHKVCWDVIICWVSRLIDNWVVTSIATDDDSDNNDSDNDDNDDNCKDNINSNTIDSESGDNNDDDGESDNYKQQYLTANEMLNYILGDEYIYHSNVRILRFDDGRYLRIAPRYEDVIKPFNEMFDCKIGFRLLRWRQTVRDLTVSFFVPIFKKPIAQSPVEDDDKEQWNYWQNNFNTMVKNIFQYFDMLEDATIEIKIPSDTLKSNDANTMQNVSTSTNDDTIEDFVYTIELWMNLCQQELKRHFDEMIDAFKSLRLQNPSWDIGFGYKFTVGRLRGNNVIDLYEYLKNNNIKNLNGEHAPKYQHKVEYPVQLKLNAQSQQESIQSLGDDTISNTQYCDRKAKALNKYCDSLEMMKYILISCVNDHENCDIRQTAIAGELRIEIVPDE